MGDHGLVLIEEALFGEQVKRLGVHFEELDREDGFGLWEIVFLELTIQTSSRGPEIRDSR